MGHTTDVDGKGEGDTLTDAQRRTEVATSKRAKSPLLDTQPTSPATPSSVGKAAVRGKRVGRYVLEEAIGEGGMGVVYAAHDPELNRLVALKLMPVRTRAKKRAGGRARLLREAQALAQLSHPNVISVFDVGTVGDDVFIAMELVDGQTVRQWLKRDRTEAEVLEVFLAGARGLAAAHRAGLVHRDFKPSNLMIDGDGRVRVLDFGLARAALTATAGTDEPAPPPDGSSTATDEGASADSASGSARGSSDDLLGSPITQAGAVVGTPAYMAPEQLRGDAVDARADQFAFCSALYEALCKRIPFSKSDRRKLMRGDDGPRPTPPPRNAMSARTWRVLERGLAVTPSQRFDSMNALIDALEPARGARWAVAWMAAAAMAVAVVAVALAVAFGGSKQSSTCSTASAELETVWSANKRAAIRDAFAATRLGHAKGVADRVIGTLDRYAQSWRAMHTEACEATNVRGVQSGELLDLRMACLDRRRQQLAVLTKLFSTNVDASTVDSAVSASLSLPKLSVCADQAVLKERARLPDDPEARARIAELRRRLDRLEAMRSAGKYREALKVAQAAALDAGELGHAGVEAEALHLLGTVQMRNTQLEQAAKTFESAAAAAAEARDDRRVAAIWLDLVWCVGERQQRPDEGLALAKSAEVAIRRAGNDAAQRAKLHFVLGALSFSKGKYEQTRKHFARSLELREAALGSDHPHVGESASALAMALSFLGRYDEAEPYHHRARLIREKAYGPTHPSVARTYSERGGAAASAGKHEVAKAHYHKALLILRKAYGEEHPGVADMLGNLGGVLHDLGERDEARASFERALHIRKKLYGDRHTRVAVSHYNLGLMHLYERRYDKAVEHALESIRIYELVHGKEHLLVADPLIAAGHARVGLRQFAEALPPLRRAQAIYEKIRRRPHTFGEIKLSMARAEWGLGRRAEARKLATEARDHYRASGERSKKELAEAEAWLAKHRR